MKNEAGNGKRLVVKSGVKAGGVEEHPPSKRLVVKSAVKADQVEPNHNSKRLVVG